MLWSHQDVLSTVASTQPRGDIADEVDALRWREAILKVSEILDHGLENRRDLAPVLTRALDHALKRLLIDGDDRELMALEAWLSEFTPTAQDTKAADEMMRQNDAQSHSHRMKDSTTWSQIADIGNEYCLHEPFTGFFSWPSIINVGHRA